MERLTESIMKVAMTLPEGVPLAAKGLLHLGSRAAVDQTLSRLAARGELIRAGRGIYMRPVQTRFGPRRPSTEQAIEALAVQRGEAIVPSGAAAANALGLTTQVPTREVFLTSGASRTLHLGSRCVELKHGNRWQLLLGKRPAGKVIRALSWLGPEGAPAALKQLRAKLPESEWEAVRGARAALPSWMAKVVSEAMAHG